MILRAATYTRYSTDNQDLTSITDQDRVNNKRVASEKFRLVKKYSDPAMSGQYSDRPDYRQMINDAEKRLFDIIVVDEISRLWRDMGEQYQAVETLKYLGIHIVGVNDGIDTRREGYELLLAVKGAQNEDFIRFVSKKTHNSMAGLVEKGLHAGGKIYGYRSVYAETVGKNGKPEFKPAGLEIDPEQAKWVIFIFEKFASGYSIIAIAKELNALGIPSPRNRTWRQSSIYGHQQKGTGILNNKIYNGIYVWNKSQWIKVPQSVKNKTGRTGRKERRERPESEWITAELPELQIIDKPLWDRAKARQKQVHENSQHIRDALHKNARTGRGPKFLFSSLLKCKDCGANYIMISHYKYGCSSRAGGGPDACENEMRVSRKIVEERLLAVIRDELLHPDALDAFRKEAIRVMKEARAGAGLELNRLKSEATKLDKEIRNLVDAVRQGHSSALLDALADAEGRKADIITKLEGLTHSQTKLQAILPNAGELFLTFVEQLDIALSTDITAARERIKAITGDSIVLRQDAEQGCLVAEIKAEYAPMIARLSGGSVNMVAGVGFGTYLTEVPLIP